MHLALREAMTLAIFPPPNPTPSLHGVGLSQAIKYELAVQRKEVRIGRNRKETIQLGGVRALTPGLEEMILLFWR
jgi:hypothetical protein